MDLPIEPAKPKEISLDQLAKLNFNEWSVEPKFDGRRLLVWYKDKGKHLSFHNKSGRQIYDVPLWLEEIFSKYASQQQHYVDHIYDGELLDGEYKVFALIRSPETRQPGYSLVGPQNILVHLSGGRITSVHPWVVEKLGGVLVGIQEGGHEGVVLKKGPGWVGPDLDRGFYPQGETDQWLKYKLYKTADVVISELWKGGKRAIATCAFDDQNHLVDTGGVSVPELVLERLQVGDVVEVEYLYATDSDKLYQPHFLRKRNDKEALDCKVSQLIHKGKDSKIE